MGTTKKKHTNKKRKNTKKKVTNKKGQSLVERHVAHLARVSKKPKGGESDKQKAARLRAVEKALKKLNNVKKAEKDRKLAQLKKEQKAQAQKGAAKKSTKKKKPAPQPKKKVTQKKSKKKNKKKSKKK